MSNDGRVDLADFLLARIAEDEALARAATPGPWDFADEHGLIPEADPAWCINQMRPGYEGMSDTEGYIGDVAEVLWQKKGSCPDAAHIARHDPARVLAECASKRQVITELLSWTEARTTEDQTWTLDHGDRAEQLAVATLRLLALPFADHPDYDESWRP